LRDLTPEQEQAFAELREELSKAELHYQEAAVGLYSGHFVIIRLRCHVVTSI
jgi:hypothetical protein